MKKLALLSTTLLLAGSLEERMDVAEHRAGQLRADNLFGGVGANTAPARAETERGVGFSLDLLYWHPKVFVQEYAITKSVQNVDPAPNRGQIKNPTFDWDFGFRAGLTYNLAYDHWDIGLDYTRVMFSSSDNTNSLVIPTLADLDTSSTWDENVAANAHMSFPISYQTVTATLGRNYFISQKVRLCPRFGAKALWLSLKPHTRYGGSALSSDNGEIGNEIRNNEDQKIRGVGPRLALYTGWHLPGGWQIETDIAGALPFCRIRLEQRQNSANSPALFDNTATEIHQVIPNAMLRLGLGYGRYLAQERRYLSLSLGYESQYYWLAFESNSGGASATFYGLTAKAALNF